MSAPRRFLVALAGTEDEALPELVSRVVGAGGPGLEATLVHVVESGPRELATHDPAFRRGPWPLPRTTVLEHRLADADVEAANSLLAVWHERFATALPEVKITHLVAQGRPEQEIISTAQALGADAVILCAHPRTGPTGPGPRSVGHVARFVLDHSPVPVLLIRRST